jgi:hypothetical protein
MMSDEYPSIIPDKFVPLTVAARGVLMKDMQNKLDRMRRVIEGVTRQLQEMEEAVTAMNSVTSETPTIRVPVYQVDRILTWAAIVGSQVRIDIDIEDLITPEGVVLSDQIQGIFLALRYDVPESEAPDDHA